MMPLPKGNALFNAIRIVIFVACLLELCMVLFVMAAMWCIQDENDFSCR